MGAITRSLHMPGPAGALPISPFRYVSAPVVGRRDQSPGLVLGRMNCSALRAPAVGLQDGLPPSASESSI